MPPPAPHTARLALAVLLTAAARAHAQDAAGLERELIDEALNRRPVRLVALDAQQVTVQNARGGTERLPVERVVAIVPLLVDAAPQDGAASARQTQGSGAGLAVLTDGQRLPGLPGPGASADALRWNSPLLGDATIPLESLALALYRPLAPGLHLPDEVSEDTALLANGDVVRGFVELMPRTGGAPALRVEPASGDPLTIEPVRVVGVRFANPPASAAGAWAWFVDGTSLALNDARVARGKLTAAAAVSGSPVAVDVAAVRAFAPRRERVQAINELPMSWSQASSDRPWTPPPAVQRADEAPLGAADIALSGPIEVVWTAPEGAERFCASVELPVTCRVWGSCDITLSSGGREVWSASLRPGSPKAAFNVQVAPGPIVLRVTDAGDGPIEDRVLIRRGLVLRR
ncbi:MAG TPA: hypothetical protein VD971_06710 [Phycisphaerales bacterium]|nr:hypothetical protein [Phycisphaerales bacterium]